MRELKYIIIHIPGSFQPRAIIFNGMFNHFDIWLGARRSIRGCEVDTAGFCSVDGNKIKAWGKSESLSDLLKREIKSGGPADEIVLEMNLSRNLHF